ncbi:MAG: YihY/virulence factor BrkB family protein [Candidatus Aminicenantia bacterium]
MNFFLITILKKIFKIIGKTFQRFFRDKCDDLSAIISFYAFLSTIPLMSLFGYIVAKILGSTEIVFRSLNIFSEEFFYKLDPFFFKKAQVISKTIINLGWFGFVGSLLIGSLVFSKLIHSINYIFRANLKKSFFYKKFIEFLVMSGVGLMLLTSLLITATWTAIQRIIGESEIVARYINPKFVSFFDNFFIQYLIPAALTFFFFFAMYKFIPEIPVKTKAALIAALGASLFWEVVKRLFAWYISHLALIGYIKGTLGSILGFILWIEISLLILLWGAELAAVLNLTNGEKA